MKIACITYRKWASEIYFQLQSIYNEKIDFLIWTEKNQFNHETLIEFHPDLILWYGWSWKVNHLFVNKFNSLMLHPSPLPKYRGGSPIQNQIINGEKLSAISIFKMSEKIDEGDIYIQYPFSLSGTLNSIFNRITTLGIVATCEIIEGKYSPKKQNHQEATYFKRRTESQSEITINELKNKTAEYIYNKVRMLSDPYPNSYIRSIDNKKIILKEIEIEDI